MISIPCKRSRNLDRKGYSRNLDRKGYNRNFENLSNHLHKKNNRCKLVFSSLNHISIHLPSCISFFFERTTFVSIFLTMSIPQAKMELRPLGNTGLKVSSVGFGASPLGSVFGPVAEVDAVATVREAFRQGINFFDTSP